MTLIFLFIFTRVSFATTISEISPTHSRPYLLPLTEKAQLEKLLEKKPWARENYDELILKAKQGDGYSAAFLFALTNQPDYLLIAKEWLLIIAKNGGDLGKRALQADAAFFKQGMPWLGDIYYNLDTRPLQAFDYIYNGLSQAERQQIIAGLSASAKFRKNAMDTWWQTPNLVFKPSSMVAIHGLLTQSPEYLEWGFFRDSKSNLGGYFSTLNNMLKDNGPWNEAPIYPVSHRPLSLSLEISDYLSRLTGKDWFSRTLSNGSSVRGLMDYFIDTTYPGEIRPNGNKVYRILTFGDGSTGRRGDMYLISNNPYQRNLKDELASAYKVSYDPDYAALLKINNDYKPDLLKRPELPESPLLPKAPSSIWKDFGLAFLRSNNNRSYWIDPNAIAASLLFKQGYGHGHSDAQSITFFAAGQLFYPDFNAVQYENPAIGWTAGSVSHNTVVVDNKDSSSPKSVNTFHLFDTDLNMIQATVKEPLGLEKKRTLVLLPRYLLDVFHLNSLIPGTFDYLLHSFGEIQVKNDLPFMKQEPFSSRYKAIVNFKALTTNKNWSIDFSMDLDQQLQQKKRLVHAFADKKNPPEKLEKAFGINNITAFKTSGIKFEMAAQSNTEVGIGEDQYGLSFLAARRKDKKNSTFIASHTPYYGDGSHVNHTLETLIDNQTGSLVKVTTDSSIDFHAISHVQGKIRITDTSATLFAEFTDYGIIQIDKKSAELKQSGNWHGYSFSADSAGIEKDISYGNIEPTRFDEPKAGENSIQVNTYPDLIVLKDFADSPFTLSITNLTDQTVSASIKLPENTPYHVAQTRFQSGLISPYSTFHKQIRLGRYKESVGLDTLPIEITLNNTAETLKHGIMVSAGPGLSENFDTINKPSYLIHTFNSSVDISKRDGSVFRIRDNQGKTIFSADNLFGLSDGTTTYSTQNNNITNSYTWPNKKQASIITQINNLIRWHLLTIQDRFYIKLDVVYTRAELVMFVFDKNNAAFEWNQARYLADKQVNLLVDTELQQINSRAFELPLKNTDLSICVSNPTSRQWLNTTHHLGISLKRKNNEQWSFGICNRGDLSSWAN